MGAEQFEDLKIVGLNVEKSMSLKSSTLRQVYLELSSTPPIQWISQFNEQRKFPRHSAWARARIDEKYIIVECIPEEIEKYHLKDLKEDVANSNKKYKENIEFTNREKERRKTEKELKERSELDRLNALNNNLNFD